MEHAGDPPDGGEAVPQSGRAWGMGEGIYHFSFIVYRISFVLSSQKTLKLETGSSHR